MTGASGTSSITVTGREAPERPWVTRWLHLAALTGFAIAQPVFDLLGRNATFFSAHRAGRGEILAVAGLLLLVTPTVGILLEWLVGLLSVRWGRLLHLVFVAVLGSLFLSPPLVRALNLSPVLAAVVFVLLGVAIGFAYDRWRVTGRILTWASIAPLVFLGWFLLATPVRAMVFGTEGSAADVDTERRPPVVFVVLDELALGGLVTTGGDIDRARFPNFGRLADLATWYPNAASVNDQTRVAVTSILTGLLPEDNAVPTATEFPHSIFTLLGASYDFEVQEAVTHVCPTRLCGEEETEEGSSFASLLLDVAVVYGHLALPEETARDLLPGIGTQWANFGTGASSGISGDLTLSEVRDSTAAILQARQEHERWDRFLARVGERERPTLFYLHSLLPHAAWRYLPDGKIYENDFFGDLFEDGAGAVWREDEVYAEQGMQRFLLQTGFVDRQIGLLLDEMGRSDLIDQSLLVVLADHGIAFDPGQPRRNLEVGADPDQILPIPMFIKYPGQTIGSVDERPTQTIDVLPTIVDALGVDVEWEFAGSSLVDTPVRDTGYIVSSEGVEETILPGISDAEEMATMFQGVFGPGGGEYDMYAGGPHRGLIGEVVDQDSVSVASGTVTATISGVGQLGQVNLEEEIIPARVTGTISEGIDPTDVALALDGRIAGVGRSYFVPDKEVWRFSLFVPTTLFHTGCNEPALYQITPDETLREITLENDLSC